MGVKTLITEEEYLHLTDFELAPDYVEGEVVERAWPDAFHSGVQGELCYWFRRQQDRAPLFPCAELQIRVAPDRYRIADVAVYANTKPTTAMPTEVPLIVVEIVSPDDRYENLMARLEDFSAWGVAHVWLVDPGLRSLHVYRQGTLVRVNAFDIPEFGLSITAPEIFV